VGVTTPKFPGGTSGQVGQLSDLEVDGTTLVVDETNNRLGIGTASPNTALTVEGAVTLKEQAGADSDTAAYGQLWVKTATPNELYFTTDAGDDVQITSGTGIAGSGGGDITGVTAGVGLSGGGSSGGVTLTLDLSELSDVTPANGDKLATLDSDGANEQLTTVADLATLFAGTGLTASSSVIGVDASQTQITAVGTIATGVWQGTAVASAYLDADTAHLSGTQTFSGAKTFSADVVISGTTPQLTIGDGGAEDTLLVFDGAAADWRMGIDDGTDVLEIGVGAAHGTTTAIGVNASAQTQVLAAFAANVAGTFGTFSDGDATPSVATGNLWKHHASAQTITMFDDGIAGQTIHVISTAAIVYDVTGTNLKGGSADITTASGDITSWFFDGTNWYLVQFMDVSADMSSVGGGGGSTDLNGLDAAAVDVAADSVGIIDANDSNNSKKESIADLATAMAGAGITATNGVFSSTLGSGGPTPAASSAENIIAFQVFS
tara:strand:+ start:8391 stop:9866 length:1476 start_codon:yes stop_codon:yes gene_type:complete